MQENFLMSVDSYKLSHWKQYPIGTTNMFSYFESRGGKFPNTLFFGLQYYLMKYLSKPITKENVEEAKDFAALHGEPFNYDAWMRIVNELGGMLPIKIKAVPEGSIIPTHNILFSVESTNEKYFWVTSWVETGLVRMWYPITIATNSWYIKQNIKKYLDLTADNTDAEIGFKLHDFGARGVTSMEQAAIGGMSHLVNFLGSDTIDGIRAMNYYYDEKMSAFSIPAAEHSTITAYGKENEVEAYRNMIKQYGDTSIFACVSDSYDIFNATENIWGGILKDEVMKMKATLVIRPDSGEPIMVINKLLDIISNRFGSTINTKGYKVLNPKVRIIQGDGVDAESINNILQSIIKNGYSASNIAFGSGGGLLQKDFNRDTQKFAFKCSWMKINGQDVDIFKDPITDPGKKSKKGILDLKLMNDKREVQTHPFRELYARDSLMQTVFENGKILIKTNCKEVRERANQEPYKQYDGWKNQ
jgi:nicotinamide phosphoribosyltransferase